MPRLFTGLEVPRDVADGLMLLQGGLPGARWISPESFHITLRFIGDVPDHAADDLLQAMERVRLASFDVQLRGVGYFGSRRPHSVHALATGNDSLTELQLVHERLCQGIGLPPETRKFKPHVTLARLRGSATADVSSYVAGNSLYASRAFSVDRFVVFSSRPSRGGGPYAVEQVYDLDLAM